MDLAEKEAAAEKQGRGQGAWGLVEHLLELIHCSDENMMRNNGYGSSIESTRCGIKFVVIIHNKDLAILYKSKNFFDNKQIVPRTEFFELDNSQIFSYNEGSKELNTL